MESKLLSGLTTVSFLLFMCTQSVVSQQAGSLKKPSPYYCITCDCQETHYCQLCEHGCEASHYRSESGNDYVCNSPIAQPPKQKEAPATSLNANPKARKRRQNTPAPTVNTTTPSTTTPIPKYVCRFCSVQNCNKCRDDVKDAFCERCLEGYQLNNVTNTCTGSEDAFSAGAIAGIVIAVLCVAGIIIAVVFFIIKKPQWSRNITSKFETRKSPFSEERKEQSVNNEKNELEALPDAPGVPIAEGNDYMDMKKRYDHLDVKGTENQESYAPLQEHRDEVYINTAAAENVYANASSHANSSAATLSGQLPGRNMSNSPAKRFNHPQPQESIETYEPVANPEDTQEIYANDDSTILVQKHKEIEDIYMNENQDATEDFYENTNVF